MKSVIYNVFNVLENIVNLTVIGVLFLIMSIYSVVCQYSPDFEASYGGYFTSIDKYFMMYLPVVVLISLMFCTLKMSLNAITLGGMYVIKCLVPVLSGVAFYFLSTPIINKVFALLNTDMAYAINSVSYIVWFWLFLALFFIKRVIDSSEGLRTKKDGDEEAEVALKYFDGNMKNVDKDSIESILLKYGGKDNE